MTSRAQIVREYLLALRLTEHRPGIAVRCCPFCGAAVDREGRA